MSLGFTFKNITSASKGVIVTEPPQITHAEQIRDVYDIPGRNGRLYGADVYRGDAIITIKMALVVNDAAASNYQTARRAVEQWLQGDGKLAIGDTNDSYYKVKQVNIVNDQRRVVHYGNIEANFTVEPYEYLTSGDAGLTSYSTITNPGDEACPLYKISGSGSGALTVNNKSVAYTSTGTLYLDTKNMIAYDGQNVNKSANVTGDYSGLRLKNGKNSVAITGGTALTVYPHWGFNL